MHAGVHVVGAVHALFTHVFGDRQLVELHSGLQVVPLVHPLRHWVLSHPQFPFRHVYTPVHAGKHEVGGGAELQVVPSAEHPYAHLAVSHPQVPFIHVNTPVHAGVHVAGGGG